MPWISFKALSHWYQLINLIVSFSIHIQAVQSVCSGRCLKALPFRDKMLPCVWWGCQKGGDSGAERPVKVQHLRPPCFLNLQSQAGSRINEWCSLMFSSKQATKLAGSLGFCADVSRIQIISFSAIMTIGGRVLPWEKRRERRLLDPVLN